MNFKLNYSSICFKNCLSQTLKQIYDEKIAYFRKYVFSFSFSFVSDCFSNRIHQRTLSWHRAHYPVGKMLLKVRRARVKLEFDRRASSQQLFSQFWQHERARRSGQTGGEKEGEKKSIPTACEIHRAMNNN